jgi:acryloyl-coenzyme A reductase
MKAAVMRKFGKPDVLRWEEDYPDPVCGARDIVVRVEACGVDYHDVVVRQGLMRRKTRSYRGTLGDSTPDISFPLVPGLEIAGTIVEQGTEVRGLELGQRVATLPRTNHCGACAYCKTGREENCPYAEFLGHDVDGGYAELVRVQYDSAVPIPDSVESIDASLAGACIGTVVRAVYDVGRVRPAERVLVTGAGGGLGTHAVQLAKVAGAEVFAVTSDSGKAERLTALGADHVVVYQRGENFAEQVKGLTRGHGVDVVIDTVGSAVFKGVWNSIADYGRIVLVGELGGEKVELRPALVFLRRLQILGSYSPGAAHLATALRLLGRNQLKSVVGPVLAMQEAAKAHEIVETSSPYGRVVLVP